MKTTRLIGCRCKCREALSLAVLIGRGLDQVFGTKFFSCFHCSILRVRKIIFKKVFTNDTFSGKIPNVSYSLRYAPLAQLVEQLTLNQRVPGSSPCWCTKNRLFGGGFLKAAPKRLICSEDSRKDTSRLENQKHRELQLTVFLGITTFFDCAFVTAL